MLIENSYELEKIYQKIDKIGHGLTTGSLQWKAL